MRGTVNNFEAILQDMENNLSFSYDIEKMQNRSFSKSEINNYLKKNFKTLLSFTEELLSYLVESVRMHENKFL